MAADCYLADDLRSVNTRKNICTVVTIQRCSTIPWLLVVVVLCWHVLQCSSVRASMNNAAEMGSNPLTALRYLNVSNLIDGIVNACLLSITLHAAQHTGSAVVKSGLGLHVALQMLPVCIRQSTTVNAYFFRKYAHQAHHPRQHQQQNQYMLPHMHRRILPRMLPRMLPHMHRHMHRHMHQAQRPL